MPPCKRQGEAPHQSEPGGPEPQGLAGPAQQGGWCPASVCRTPVRPQGRAHVKSPFSALRPRGGSRCGRGLYASTHDVYEREYE